MEVNSSKTILFEERNEEPQSKETAVENLNRRQIMGMTAAGLAATMLGPERAHANGSERTTKKRPVLHVTDLFRPHMDPDDHWDLACVYALVYRGDIDLAGVLIDHPPDNSGGRNPDTAAVAQMNFIAGTAVPVTVGSSLPLRSRSDIQTYALPTDHHGVKLILDVLRQSSQPVVINILGQSRDVAIAGRKAPDLFASKCAAIYLNAGTGSPDMSPKSKLEYNVTLDRFSYAAIFDLPCPSICPVRSIGCRASRIWKPADSGTLENTAHITSFARARYCLTCQIRSRTTSHTCSADTPTTTGWAISEDERTRHCCRNSPKWTGICGAREAFSTQQDTRCRVREQ